MRKFYISSLFLIASRARVRALLARMMFLNRRRLTVGCLNRGGILLTAFEKLFCQAVVEL